VTGTNDLAYYGTDKITAVERFMIKVLKANAKDILE
jgi:hypothetical protein